MHTPSLFREADPARLHDLIESYCFGTLVAQSPGGGLEISHIPFLLDRNAGAFGRLRCHVARTNPLWRAVIDGGPVVAIFSGPSAYVSARWYERPEEHVPTWNYAVVHVHGRVEGPATEDELRQQLEDMAAMQERGAAQPWSLAELPGDLAQGLMGGIVGLSIRIEHIEGNFKLSQNRTPADRRRVMEALAARGAPADLEVLRLMRQDAQEP